MPQNWVESVEHAASSRLDSLAPVPPAELRTLVQVARWRAEQQPQELAFTFLTDGEQKADRLRYGDLDRRARTVAAELQRRGGRGQRVVLLFNPGVDFIVGLYGCLYAGALPVPVNPPEPLRLSRTLPRLHAVLEDSQARFLLGSEEVFQYVSGGLADAADTERIALEEIPDSAELERHWRPAAADDQELALLQYTSGSTGRPRGIVLTHANLMHSVAGMHREDSADVVGVCWLPPYHDFGLIAGVLLPVYSGRRTVLMSPLSFVERPMRWLQAISRHRGTTTGAPNFAYELCVRKMRPDECRDLDLSCWRIAAVAAEPVRATMIERFSEAFRPYGFRREAFLPAYGLAEAVLNVTCKRWYRAPVLRSFARRALEEKRVEEVASGDSSGQELVGCGEPWPSDRVLIVDPETCRPLGPGAIGEVWVQSPQVGQGYWNRPEETEYTFRARLADDPQATFLRTGDLGFFHASELFVVGRIKELIILDGRNYYPHDIERAIAGCHPALRPNEGAAFSCDLEGQERLVIVHEVRRSSRYSLDDVLTSIRRELAEEYLFSPYAIVLIPGGTLPKTSSGKIRRRTCREMYLRRELEIVAEWRAEGEKSLQVVAEYVAPRTPLEATIAAAWVQVLRLERVGVHDNFFAVGGSSLLATELYHRLRDVIPGDLPLGQLFERPTVAGLAELILARQAEQVDSEQMATLLERLEHMSEDQASRLQEKTP
jgi:acyl-CoA synthetase (AMP-forming)/AMP-acid ligase II